MAKSSINLVSVHKPSVNSSPILQRRNKLTATIEQQIAKIDSYRAGRRISKAQFWVDGSDIFYSLKYGKMPLELDKGKSTLKAANFDDLVAQLEEIKTITIAGGLDQALNTCANAVRSNFKAAKDKKAGKGA